MQSSNNHNNGHINTKIMCIFTLMKATQELHLCNIGQHIIHMLTRLLFPVSMASPLGMPGTMIPPTLFGDQTRKTSFSKFCCFIFNKQKWFMMIIFSEPLCIIVILLSVWNINFMLYVALRDCNTNMFQEISNSLSFLSFLLLWFSCCASYTLLEAYESRESVLCLVIMQPRSQCLSN